MRNTILSHVAQLTPQSGDLSPTSAAMSSKSSDPMYLVHPAQHNHPVYRGLLERLEDVPNSPADFDHSLLKFLEFASHQSNISSNGQQPIDNGSELILPLPWRSVMSDGASTLTAAAGSFKFKRRLILARHGETAFNQRRVLQGCGVDQPLNDRGMNMRLCSCLYFMFIV